MSYTIAKSNFIAYLLPFIILCYTFSLIWGWFPMTSTIYVPIIGLLVSIVVCRGYVEKKVFVFLMWYILVLAFNMMRKDPLHNSTNGFLFEMLSLVVTSMMGYYYLMSKDDNLIKLTVLLLLWMLIINAIGSSFVDSIFPGGIRAAITDFHHTGNLNLAFSFYKYGMASYDLVHAVPTIIPMLVYGIKVVKKPRVRYFFVAVLISCMMLCYLGGSTTALLTGLFGLLISVFTKVGSGRKQIIRFSILTVLVFFLISNDTIMLSFLNWADNMVGDASAFHSKIMDFEASIVYGDSSDTAVQGRSELYNMSFSVILSNPIFGTNADIIGHHSTLLDHWACLGLLGFIPYVYFIYLQLKMTASYLSEASLAFFVEGVVLALLMLGLKSIDTWESWLFLFVLLPLLAIYIGNQEDVKFNRS